MTISKEKNEIKENFGDVKADDLKINNFNEEIVLNDIQYKDERFIYSFLFHRGIRFDYDYHDLPNDYIHSYACQSAWY